MTTYTPTPEAVEAAARAAGMYGRVAQDGLTPEQRFERDWQDEEYRDRALGRARAALAAAGPLISAEVRGQREAFLPSDTLDPAWIAGWHAAVDHVAAHIESGGDRAARLARGEGS
jgi:hypothetical protein